jgi:hypothetical protein
MPYKGHAKIEGLNMTIDEPYGFVLWATPRFRRLPHLATPVDTDALKITPSQTNPEILARAASTERPSPENCARLT